MTNTTKQPQGDGHALLEEWALWSRGGYPTGRSTWSVKERLDPPRDQEPPERVILIDRIVARLGVNHPQYRRILKRFYLDTLSVWEIAGTLQYTPGFVALSLQAACDWVARNYEELTAIRGECA